MSATCRRHVGDIAKCCQILADIACRCDTEEAPTYPIYINYTNKYKSAQTYGYLSYLEFLCLSSNNNHEITNMSGIPRHVVKCRVVLDTLADTTFSCVCDMTSDVLRHVTDTTQNVAVWATKTTRRHPTYGAKAVTAIMETLTGRDSPGRPSKASTYKSKYKKPKTSSKKVQKP